LPCAVFRPIGVATDSKSSEESFIDNRDGVGEQHARHDQAVERETHDDGDNNEGTEGRSAAGTGGFEQTVCEVE
jgi:hypothetical protein